jgi:lipopolysaccharide biosynthesis glycosyltransferase
MSGKIRVAISGDNSYLMRYGATYLTNLFRLHAAGSVTLYIMSLDLSDQVEADFQKIAAYFGQELVVLRMTDGDLSGIDALEHGGNRWGRAAFYWLLLGEKLPDVNQVIFSDLDVLICQDLTEFYRQVLPVERLIQYFSNYYTTSMADFVDGKDYPIDYAQKGFLGNSGFMLLNLQAFREAGVTNDWLNQQAQELAAKLPLVNLLGKDLQVFGDQGFAQVVFPNQSHIIHSHQVVQGIDMNTYHHIDETTVAIHFAGGGFKPQDIQLKDVVDHPFSDVAMEYNQNRQLGQMLMGDFETVTSDIFSATSVQRDLLARDNDFRNLAQYPYLDRVAWRESVEIPNAYVVKSRRPNRELAFYFENALELEANYHIHLKVRTNFTSEKPIRLMARSPQNFTEIMSFQVEADQIVEMTIPFTPGTDYERLFFSSTDFLEKNLSRIEFLALSLEKTDA